MTHPFTIARERLRTQIDAAICLKPTLAEPFERVVVQRVLDNAFVVVSSGDVAAMATMEDKLHRVISVYSPKKKDVA